MENETPNPAPAAPAAPPATPPPAAAVVSRNGPLPENRPEPQAELRPDVRPEPKAESGTEDVKKLQTRISELEDQNFKLKNPARPSAPAAERKKTDMEKWFDGESLD